MFSSLGYHAILLLSQLQTVPSFRIFVFNHNVSTERSATLEKIPSTSIAQTLESPFCPCFKLHHRAVPLGSCHPPYQPWHHHHQQRCKNSSCLASAQQVQAKVERECDHDLLLLPPLTVNRSNPHHGPAGRGGNEELYPCDYRHFPEEREMHKIKWKEMMPIDVFSKVPQSYATGV